MRPRKVGRFNTIMMLFLIQLGAFVKMRMEIRLYYYNWYDQIKYIRDKMRRVFYKCFTE